VSAVLGVSISLCVCFDKNVAKQKHLAALLRGCSFERKLNCNEELWSHDGGGSGGYLHHVAFYAAEQLLGTKLEKLDYRIVR